MKSVFRIWWLSLAVKLALAVVIPMTQDEAYYWIWSHHLQLSYFDHPPMVAWLLSLGHFLEFFGQAVRWPSVILGHASLWIWIKILSHSNHFTAKQIGLWLSIALVAPLVGFGSLICTPDVPLVFFWSASLYFLLRLHSKQQLLDYAFLGACLGLGFCSKYHVVLFIPALLLTIIMEKDWRKFRWSGVAITLLVGSLFSSPVLIWNYQNDFVSFRYQLNHGFGNTKWDPFWTYSYLFGQILILFPTTVWAAVRAKPPKDLRFLIYFAWFPLAFFIISSFRGPVEVNWPITAHLTIFALAIVAKNLQRSLLWSVGVWGVLGTAVLILTIFPMPRNVLQHVPEKVVEGRYFDPLKPFVENYSPLYLGSYQMTATMWYEFKRPFMKLYEISRHDFFDEIQNGPPPQKHFFLLKEPWVPLPQWMKPEVYKTKQLQEIPPKFELLEVNQI